MGDPKPNRRLERCPSCGRKQRRSNAANARYWLLLHALAERLPVQGQLFSAESWHLWAKSKFLGAVDVKLPSGKVIIVPNSTATLDTAAFNDFMASVEAWAAEHDVYLDEIFEAA